MAIDHSGVLWAWGTNDDGQLGVGDTLSRNTPTQVGEDFVAVSSFHMHSLALKSNGTLWAWGSDSFGQLGITSEADVMASIPTLLSKTFSYASAGTRTAFGVDTDGSLWGWGNNYYGQVGDGTRTNRSTPTKVGTGYVQIASGDYNVFGIKTDGSMWSWGFHPGYRSTVSNLAASAEFIGNGYKSVSNTMRHILALKENGDLWAWGENLTGQVGNGSSTSTQVDEPYFVGGGYKAVATGYGHSLALKLDGSIWAAGMNSSGQLGDGTTTSSSTFKKVGDGYTAIAAGLFSSFAIKSDGDLFGWGSGPYLSLIPTKIGQGVANVAAGQQHILWQTVYGTVMGLGTNSAGQLGDGTLVYRGKSTLTVNSTSDGTLDLVPESRKSIPAEKLPPFFIASVGDLSVTSATVATTTKFNPADQGKSGAVFVAASVPNGSFGTTPVGQNIPSPLMATGPHPTRNAGITGNGFTLIQLTPTGWQTVVNGKLIPYANGVLGDQLAAQTILNGADTTNLKGAEFCVGYGTSAQDMIDNGNIRAVATIPGAATPSTCAVGTTLSSSISVTPGWNLLGNPINQTIAMGEKFGDATKIGSVWKWDVAKANWQFYAPSMSASDLLAYATAKNYAVLSEISPGDGYWVNAKVQADLGTVSGNAVYLRQSSLASGWNLVSTASPISAKDFNLTLSTTPPTSGQVPTNMTSLWAWDSARSNWYFYAPSLDQPNNTALTDYINAKGYEDFSSSGKTLGNGVGVWVNRP